MTTVREIVRGQNLAQLASNSTIREAARYMVDHGVGSVLVMEEGTLRGIFTERDALRVFVATRRNPDLTHLAEVMTEAPQTLPPDATPQDAVQRMTAGKFRHMPVVDGEGRVLGVVSQRDLVAVGAASPS
ncbi:CBS domain-containing protein [Pelagibius sp.]|uniref:CBS domain-containing protein n=1 Tax=Pelagibius sp. TaxID=1931238 RepID=UPI003B5061D3